MGANQSRSSSSSPFSPVSRASTSHSTSSSRSSGSSRSNGSNGSNGRMGAVRHHKAPAAPPGSRREFLLQQQQQQLVAQEEFFGLAEEEGVDPNLFADFDGYYDGETYVTYAAAEVPSYFVNEGGCQTGAGPGLSVSRSRAVHCATSPEARPGSRREMMLKKGHHHHGHHHGHHHHHHGGSSRSASRASHSATAAAAPAQMVSFDDMGLAAPAPQFSAPTLYPPGATYVVKPKAKGGAPFKSRFREDL